MGQLIRRSFWRFVCSEGVSVDVLIEDQLRRKAMGRF